MFFSFAIGALLTFGNIQVDVEIANTPTLQEKGLMYRKLLRENQGMLFIYPREKLLSFWMKNTSIPLSIGFFDAKQTLVQIEDMDPPHPEGKIPPSYTSKTPCQYALEVPQGWFKKNKVEIGNKFSLQYFD